MAKLLLQKRDKKCLRCLIGRAKLKKKKDKNSVLEEMGQTVSITGWAQCKKKTWDALFKKY